MMENSSGLVYQVDTQGGKISTTQVVDKAIALKQEAEKAKKPYDAVWAVFDRDDFKATTFDKAINKANQNGIGCAWSNEAFELWYVYHFDNRNTSMSRKDYEDIITKRVRGAGYCNGNKKYTYLKNDPKMRSILRDCKCDENLAIKYAERQSKTFIDNKFHDHNPCTMVYKLVRQLIGKDKAFINIVKSKLEEK